MTFKNRHSAHFGLRAHTTLANEPQNLWGYWTEVHQIFRWRRGIIADVNATIYRRCDILTSL